MKKVINISLVILLMAFNGCDESISDAPIENIAPDTHLFLFTDEEISQQKSKLQIHWWGDDKDGIVIGYLIKWEGIDDDWTFTTANDSIFSLPIGTVDTSFTFLVASVDNSGNGIYDESVFLNGVKISSEPYLDQNNNGSYDIGEPFFDFGAIDESPSSRLFPIKNSSPEITWNDISVLPEKSFPTMTVGWNAFDLDGNETITEIHIALNDTSDYVTLSGSTRLVSLIIDDLESISPEMNVFVNADENKQLSNKLKNLRLDDFNRLYVRGIDNSGASSRFIALPDTGRTWFVEKPKGDLLIIDDFINGTQAREFYREKFNSFAPDQYNELDLELTTLPYESITFRNTINLFDYVFWYSGSNPSLELTNLVTQNYIQKGGKIAFSMTFQDSSSNFEFSTPVVQTFLPIESFNSPDPLSFMFPGANIIPTSEFDNFVSLKTESTIGFVRTFKVSEITATQVYDLTSSQINGEIAFINNTKNLFFIGLPLNQCDANSNVSDLLEQIFTNEFGMN